MIYFDVRITKKYDIVHRIQMHVINVIKPQWRKLQNIKKILAYCKKYGGLKDIFKGIIIDKIRVASEKLN